MTPRLREAVLGGGLALALMLGCHRAKPSGTSSPAPAQDEVTPVRHFPGVDLIRTATGGVKIRVLSGAIGPNPLYVVDGTPVTIDPNRGIDWLTPEQIAKVEVLKDPAQTAVYGLRGIQGVILITSTNDR